MKSTHLISPVFLSALFFISSCAIYKKYDGRDFSKIEEIKAGTNLKVITNQSKPTYISLIKANDSLFTGRKISSSKEVNIKTSDIKEIWIRSYHDSTSREGFLIGFGLGRSRLSRNFSDGIHSMGTNFNTPNSESKFGWKTEFRIGHAYSDQFAIYYRSIVIFSDYHFSNSNYDATLLTSFNGVGGVYFFRKTAPTLYGNVSLGFGRSGFALDDGYNKGLAIGVGLGYQFARRWNIELDFDFINLEPNEYSQIPEHDKSSVSLTLLYCWFKNYR